MSNDKKHLQDLISKTIDNSTQDIHATVKDIWFLIFGSLSQFDSNLEIQFITDPDEIQNELHRRSYEMPIQITSSEIYNVKMAFLNQFNKYYSSQLNKETIEQYLNIYEKLKLKSVSNITSKKCILDPLGNPISDINNVRIDVSEVNDWMLNELKRNPTDLYKLSSRRFEELIAEILIRKGYKVELTPATRDGGKDIYAAHKDDLGSFLYIVECKRYKPQHKVGVNVLRDLYGVLSKERATYGIAVTTSYFSEPAQEFQQELQFQMSLKDFNSIKQWLHDVT